VEPEVPPLLIRDVTCLECRQVAVLKGLPEPGLIWTQFVCPYCKKVNTVSFAGVVTVVSSTGGPQAATDPFRDHKTGDRASEPGGPRASRGRNESSGG
jgi:hypothetical protein